MFCSYFNHVSIKALWCSGQKMCSQTSCTSRIFSALRFITSLVLWHSGTGSLSTRWGQKRCDPAAASSDESSNCLPGKMCSHGGCTCLTFFHGAFHHVCVLARAARASYQHPGQKEVTRATACNRFVFSPCANRRDARHRYLGRCDMSSVA